MRYSALLLLITCATTLTACNEKSGDITIHDEKNNSEVRIGEKGVYVSGDEGKSKVVIDEKGVQVQGGGTQISIDGPAASEILKGTQDIVKGVGSISIQTGEEKKHEEKK